MDKLVIRLLLSVVLVFSAGALRAQGPHAGASGPAPDDRETLIRKLYKEYLPQYVKNEYWFDKPNTLEKYFGPRLISLFLRDERCKARTHEICNLDFDPIIAAQDFDEKYPYSLEIEKLTQPGPPRYQITFSNLGARTMIYEFTRTKNGWRIADIRYADGPSLRTILSRKP